MMFSCFCFTLSVHAPESEQPPRSACTKAENGFADAVKKVQLGIQLDVRLGQPNDRRFSDNSFSEREALYQFLM